MDALNADAHKDLVIGAPKEQQGRVDVFLGPFDENCPLFLSADYANLILVCPDAETFDFGAGLRRLPDITGDGLDEIMVRGTYASTANGTIYRTYIFSGTGAYRQTLEGDATGNDSGGGQASAMGGSSGASCYGDIAGPGGTGDPDGWVNVNDLLLVMNSWGPCSPLPASCTADIAPRPSGDGVVNANDMIAVINAWGPCPVQGIVYQSNGTGGGDWFDPNTWDPPGVPGTQQHCDAVRIRAGDTINQSAKYSYTLGLYLLDGGTHQFSGDADIAALDVEVFSGRWTRDGTNKPNIVVRNAAVAFRPRNADIIPQWDCATFCALLSNPYYPYNLLPSCQENPCMGGSGE